MLIIAVIKKYVKVKSVSWYPEENNFSSPYTCICLFLPLITTGKEKHWGNFSFSNKYHFIHIFNVKNAPVSLGTKW